MFKVITISLVLTAVCGTAFSQSANDALTSVTAEATVKIAALQRAYLWHEAQVKASRKAMEQIRIVLAIFDAKRDAIDRARRHLIDPRVQVLPDVTDLTTTKTATVSPVAPNE